MLRKIVSREWILTTILVLLGSGLCVRLGIWQLDRLDQRRQFNAHVEAMWAADALSLPADASIDLVEMEYRSVCVTGEYDFGNQVAIRNQYWNDQFGYHLLTPVVMADGTAIMVDRGWIPAEGNDQPNEWRKYDDKATGQMCGIIRQGREKPDMGGRPDPTLTADQTGLLLWNNVNLTRMEAQMPYDLAQAYIQLNVTEGDDLPPIPYQPEIEISEGPHLGYAGQWFVFATILFFGYPFYISWRERTE